MEVNFEKYRSDCAVSLLKAFQWAAVSLPALPQLPFHPFKL